MNKKILFLALLSMTGIGFTACSKVDFQSVPSSSCADAIEDFGKDACKQTPDGYNTFNYTVTVGDVDIVFVDDNSGSMSAEQNQMASRFPNFINSIANLNYQIGIITTDVSYSPSTYSSSRAANGFGAYQDGKFLKFDGADYILKKGETDVHGKFTRAIKRQETIDCETSYAYNLTLCPSGDERGIFALNLMLDRGDSRMFRPGAHLAVVILSDEDERSNPGAQALYPLQEYDLPATFVSKVAARLGTTKTVSVHSVIIQPGDTGCYNQNNIGNGIFGSYGYSYAALSQPSATLKALGGIVDGAMGSICAADYGAQLGNIGAKIATNVKDIQLACAPVTGSVSVTFSPAPSTPITYTVDSSNKLKFTPAVPAGTAANITYKCHR